MKLIKAKTDWCSPCRVLSTMLDGFKLVPIEELNIDLDPDRTRELGIRSVPTLILLDSDDNEVWRHSGVIDKIQLETIIKKYNFENRVPK